MQVVWARMIGPAGRRNSQVRQQDGTVNGSGDGTRRQRDWASWSAIRRVGPRRCGEPNLRLARDPGRVGLETGRVAPNNQMRVLAPAQPTGRMTELLEAAEIACPVFGSVKLDSCAVRNCMHRFR